MSTKIKVIIVFVSLLVSFAAGRYSVPEKIKIETKVVEVEKKKEDIKKHRRKTTITDKDGSTTTIIDTTIEKKSDEDISLQKDTTTEKVRGDSKVSLALMSGIDVTNPQKGLVYGVSVQKPVLGPITIGLWGFNTGTMGASVGLTF